MLDMADALELLTAGLRAHEVAGDIRISLAVTRALEVFGEAAARLSEERKAAAPDIPWREIIAMRNRLAHGYFDLNPDIVWDTATVGVPSMVGSLRRLLADL